MAVDDSGTRSAALGPRLEKNACLTLRFVRGYVHREPMNCLNEAIGLALPGNGTTPGYSGCS